LFSFRASLMANVPEAYFQYPDGRWLDAACDFALAYPMLDQTRRYRFIPIHAYRYTESNPHSHHNQAQERQTLSSPKQRQCAQLVLAMPPLPRIDQKDEPALAAAALRASKHDPATAWEPACAVRLLETTPALLDELPASQLHELDAVLLTEWQQQLKRLTKPKVLIGGAGPQMDALRCIVTQGGGQFTLWRAQQATDAEPAPDAQTVLTPWAEYVLDDEAAYLPEVDAIVRRGPFDMVVLSPDAWGGRCQPLIALAALGPLLPEVNFQFYVLGPQLETLQVAGQEIANAMGGVDVKVDGQRTPWLRVRS
jgi:hypothetical protein